MALYPQLQFYYYMYVHVGMYLQNMTIQIISEILEHVLNLSINTNE